MKKRHIALICIGALLLLFVSVIAAKIIADNQKYHISGEIKAVEVVSSLDGPAFYGGPKKTSEKDHITILLDCLKKVKRNNKYRIKGIAQAPIFYEITFFYDNGKIKSYNYTVYPSTKYKDPFKEFYNLFSVDE